MLFRCRIQVRGRFIKDEDRCVFQKCASDRKPLPLPARETDPAFADECVVSIRQFHDEVMQACRLAGADDVGMACTRPTVRDVLSQGRREDDRLLQHQRNLSA